MRERSEEERKGRGGEEKTFGERSEWERGDGGERGEKVGVKHGSAVSDYSLYER